MFKVSTDGIIDISPDEDPDNVISRYEGWKRI